MSDNNKNLAVYVVATIIAIGFVALVLTAMFKGWLSF